MRARRRRAKIPALGRLAAAVLMLFVALPGVAVASTYTEGTASRPFHLADTGGLIVTTATADPSLIVPLVASTVFNGTSIEFEPRSIAILSDGSYLVACGKHGTLARISRSGTLLRVYTSSDIPGMERPFDAQPTSDGGFLIVDRSAVQGQGFIFRVDSSLNVTWHFGGSSGVGAGQVFDPFTARILSGGRTLVSDSLGNRVIEIDNDTGEIVWSFGEFKVAGSDSSHLDRPHSAERLSNGNTLICDSNNQRVIEVTRSGSVVWRYGSGTPGSGTGQLQNPNSATRLANGHTLICDSDNQRVVEVDHAGQVVQVFGKGGIVPPGGNLSDVRVALRRSDGSTIIADTSNMRLAAYGVAPHKERVATSEVIDPQAGARKQFIAIRVRSTIPAGSAVTVEYSINSGDWTDLQGTKLPSDAIGTNIRYRIRLSTGSAAAAPAVRDVTIEWAIAGASGTPTSGGQKSTTSGTGSSSGSGGKGSGAAPGGTNPIGGGTHGGTAGTGGDAVTGANTVSGWVMSEEENTVGKGGSGPGAGTGAVSLDSTSPGIALLLIAYASGVAWPAVVRFFVRPIAATMSKWD